MAATQSKYDASASLLGFLYQTRFALLLGLRHNAPEVLISVEKIDDIAFVADNDSDRPVPFDVRQLKHHVSRQGGLGNKSEDIWKTLKIWAEAVSSNTLDPTQSLMFLITTSNATRRHAVSALSPDAALRDPERARSELEAAGASSTASAVTVAYNALLQMSERKRKQLFAAIYLLDGSHDVAQLRSDIEAEVRFVTDPEHRIAFTDALEGWWFRRVVDHLMVVSHQGILVREVEEQVSALREQFRRVNLPDELADATVPDSETKDDDTRAFVRQLLLIDLSTRRIGSAQEDHYRAYEQRSRWVRQHLVGMDELHKLEVRLVDEWRRRFDIMLEGVDVNKGEYGLCHSGRALYEWVELDAPENPSLFVRPEFRSPYMTRGSYHMLADRLRLGWHPHFESRLNNDEGTSDAC